jgi:hypothetical protein
VESGPSPIGEVSESGECRLGLSEKVEEPIVSSTAVFLIAFAFTFGGALIGVGLRKALPEYYLADDTKNVVRSLTLAKLCRRLCSRISVLLYDRLG